jgi:cell division transport system ATP-binding protein
MPAVLRLQGVGLRYGDGPAVLQGIELSLAAGSFHFLSGPTGAGKTSLLRVASLAVPPSVGSIELFGRTIDKLDRQELATLRQRIGVVFQDFRLLEHLTVFDNVALPLRINGADEDETASFVADMLAWLGLADKLEALPHDLSMGQRQLVCIARAVVAKPRLLLADEPTSNIDSRNAGRLMNLFMQLHKLGATVLLATHSDALMDRYPFPILTMEGGRLVAAEGPRTLEPEPLRPEPAAETPGRQATGDQAAENPHAAPGADASPAAAGVRRPKRPRKR